MNTNLRTLPAPTPRKTNPFPQRSFAVEPIKLSYSVEEAASALGTSETAIRGYIRNGQLPTFSLPGLKRVLIKATDLIAFVNEQPSVRRSRSS